MALLSPSRIQPSLLDRLIDDSPSVWSGQSANQFRESVRRDLSHLLNAHAALDAEDRRLYPLAATSVVNYGIRDLSGLTVSALEAGELERHLAQALRSFEPRLMPRTIVVTALERGAGSDRPTALGFELRGQLWAQPVPESWQARTEIDLETGNAAILG